MNIFELCQLPDSQFHHNSGGDENINHFGAHFVKDGKYIWASNKYRFNADTVNKVVSKLPDYDRCKVSDGYHSFDELYEHRVLLFIALCNLMPAQCHKTKKNFEKQEWEGWFILVLHHPIAGQISYHIPNKYWDSCRCESVEWNHTFDGHNSNDVINRLKKNLNFPCNTPH